MLGANDVADPSHGGKGFGARRLVHVCMYDIHKRTLYVTRLASHPLSTNSNSTSTTASNYLSAFPLPGLSPKSKKIATYFFSKERYTLYKKESSMYIYDW